VLLTLPKLDDDKAHALSELAEAVGTDEATLLHDLRTLVDRGGGEPPGFLDSVALAVDATTVRLQAPGFFRRPMGFSAAELHALELGLAMLAQESPPEEYATLDRARVRLRRALSGLPPIGQTESSPATHAAHAGAEPEPRRALRALLQRCVADRVVATLKYQRASDTMAEWRDVRPLGFVFARGSWYLVALGARREDVRVFRFDRIAAARATTQQFEPPSAFSLSDVVRDGRVFTGTGDETLRVRYSPWIARWIAEREGVPLAEDGSVTIEHPLGDREWAVRFVLQYGADAEVEGPEDVREAVRGRLREMGAGGAR
jgi:predicted DNA-binding transcriptional regulator YafY